MTTPLNRMWRVTIREKDGTDRKARVHVFFVLAETAEAAKALAAAEWRLPFAPAGSVLAVVAELASVVERGPTHLTALLTAKPDTIPTPEAIEAATKFLAGEEIGS